MKPVVIPFDALMGDNHRLIPARGRLIANSKYRDAKAALRLRLTAHRPRLTLHDGRVALECTFHWPDRRKRDVTNYGKMLCDALTGIAFHDDVQIVDARYRFGGYDKANPRVEIVIQEAA